MRPRLLIRTLVLGLACLVFAVSPPHALAFNPVKPVCSVAGFISGAAGKVCKVVQEPGRVVKATKKLAGGHVIGAAKSLLGGDSSSGNSGSSTSNARAATVIGLAAIGAWVLGGARFAMHETAKVLSQTTAPQLRSTWFSSAYWRMAAIATVLTLPFLFAAAVQALIRSDVSMLARATFGYLPIAMLSVGIAAPVTMLLLVASDQMSAAVSAVAADASVKFLTQTAIVVGALTILSPFIAFLIGLFTASAAFMLWLELLVREAAVYVIVLMLPLAFAALVWPARRIWALRAVELLVALILSKFAIVAVLSLGGAALGSLISGHSVTGALAGGALVLLAVFAPWALLRLLPLAELASGATGSLRRETLSEGRQAWAIANGGTDRAENLLGGMRTPAENVGTGAIVGEAAGERLNGKLPRSQPAAAPHRGERNEADPGQSQPTEQSAAETADEAPAMPAAADHDAAATAYTAAQADAGEDAASPSKERLPGMEERWQQENFSWPPLELDADHLLAPDPSAQPMEGEADRPIAGNPSRAPRKKAPADRNYTSDEPDPTPSQQPPLEGRL
ncbi:MAG: hypothetical protein JOZ73_10895 [Solirubrobacterales bacterium]|nr:hypothetical protein [Solirubrobacterales bacterium]